MLEEHSIARFSLEDAEAGVPDSKILFELIRSITCLSPPILGFEEDDPLSSVTGWYWSTLNTNYFKISL